MSRFDGEFYDKDDQEILEKVCEEVERLRKENAKLRVQNAKLREQVSAQEDYMAWCRDIGVPPKDVYPEELK